MIALPSASRLRCSILELPIKEFGVSFEVLLLTVFKKIKKNLEIEEWDNDC